jgi:hypothetical protein
MALLAADRHVVHGEEPIATVSFSGSQHGKLVAIPAAKEYTMMKTAIATLSVLGASLALLVFAGPSAADENMFGTCPDGYTPAPFLVSPGDDKNGNGVLCVKFVDEHDNVKDDPNGKKYACNGFPTLPSQCVGAGFLFVRDDLL